MTSIADGSVIIQTSTESVPSTPSWFGEATLLVGYLRQHGVLAKISEQVRFARRRFGRYEVIDFLAVLFGYAISGERTLEDFYARLSPFAGPFMALFDRDRLPARSTLSRFLAALTEAPVAALRTLFLEDLLSRPPTLERQIGNLIDRASSQWLAFDLDGTREAARQRALPQTEDPPSAQRRLDDLCAPGYSGRKRGQVVRTRTGISQAHTYQWLGSFGNRGNGRYLTTSHLSGAHALLQLDGQYGTGAVLADLAGFAFVTRGKDYTVLDHPLVQARLHLPPDQVKPRPESQVARSLYDWTAGTSWLPGCAMPRCRGDPSGFQQKESRWRHALRRGLRTVLQRAFRSKPSPPAMSSNCTCTGELSSLSLPMRIKSRTPIGGALTPPGGRRHGGS